MERKIKNGWCGPPYINPFHPFTVMLVEHVYLEFHLNAVSQIAACLAYTVVCYYLDYRHVS